MAELLYEMWKLIGRSKVYTTDFKFILLMPICKKGDPSESKNYRPVCMLSCLRKIIKAAIAERISKVLKLFGRNFGFQKGLSPKITLLDVDAVLKEGRNSIATLNLAKAYDKVNCQTLLQDCK